MIVKVQVPIGAIAPILIYNEDRSFTVTMKNDDLVTRMREDFAEESQGLKGFYNAFVVAGVLSVGEKAPWQNW